MAPTILVITHLIPSPPAAGNELRILQMINWLKREGYTVVLLLSIRKLDRNLRQSLHGIVDHLHLLGDSYGAEFRPVDARTRIGARLKKRMKTILLHGHLFHGCLPNERRERIEYDAIKKSFAPNVLIQITEYLCSKYHLCAVIAEYIFTAPCLDVVPRGVLKIIDTHDMFSRKKEQVLHFGIEDQLLCTPKEERNYLLKSDLVIAIQSKEAHMFRDLVPERDVITVSIDLDVVSDVDNSEVVPGTILFIGSGNPLNVHGFKEFYGNSWPLVRSRYPDAVLRVVGNLGKHLTTDDESIKLVGWLEDLNVEYRKAAVVINPAMAGTGLKIKSVEALCRAKPLVGTPNSVEGIDYDGEPPFIVGSNWRDFAYAVLMLLKSDIKRLELQNRALRYAKENFSSAKVYGPLGKKLKSFLRVRG